jgi:cytoskeletal protein CcmA (bactofilin family)
MSILSSKKNKEHAPVETGGFNVLNEGTTVTGDIESKGDIRIDGVLVGTVRTKSKLVLGRSGRIEGNVEANSCDVNGVVQGNVKINDILYVKATGKIEGDINTGKLVVESGGRFNGKCSMGSSTTPIDQGRKIESKQGAVA